MQIKQQAKLNEHGFEGNIIADNVTESKKWILGYVYEVNWF